MSETLASYRARVEALAGGGLWRRVRTVVLANALRGEEIAKGNVDRVLRRRTGRLHNSIRGEVRDASQTVDLVLRAGGGSGSRAVRYARIHEKGGVIEPRNGRFLAIPTPLALAGRGGAGANVSPAAMRTKLVFLATRGGAGGVLVRERARGGSVHQLDVFFRLVRRVTIPARPYLAPALQAVRAPLREDLHALVSQAVRGGSRANG